MNGYASGEEKEQPKPCDIVHITGKPENCEAAKQSLLDIVPITVEVRSWKISLIMSWIIQSKREVYLIYLCLSSPSQTL